MEDRRKSQIPRRESKPKPDRPTVDTPGLWLKKLVDEDGNTPDGCSGFVHLLGDWDWETGLCTVSDGGTTGRFWAARYDPERDLYIKLSRGEQFKDGVVVEVFP